MSILLPKMSILLHEMSILLPKMSILLYIMSILQHELSILLYFSDVKDIHDVLEVTVYDEDKDHKYEFLGKVSIPLLKIKNNEKKWFLLKDKKLRIPAKGEQPQILMEMFFVYNKIRASIRTFNPKQIKYEDRSDIKFKHSVFMRNVNRVKAATADFDPEVVIREIQ